MAKKILIGALATSVVATAGAVVAVVEANKTTQVANQATQQAAFYQASAPKVATKNNHFIPAIVNGVEDLSSDSAENPLMSLTMDSNSLKTFFISYSKVHQSTFSDYFFNVVAPIFNPSNGATATTKAMADKIIEATKNLFNVNPMSDPRVILANEIVKTFASVFTPGSGFSSSFSEELEKGQHQDLVNDLVTNMNAHASDDSFMKKMSTNPAYNAFVAAKANFADDVKAALPSAFQAYASLLDDWSTNAGDINTFYNNATPAGYVDQSITDNFNKCFSIVFGRVVGNINNPHSAGTPNVVVTSFTDFINTKKDAILKATTDDNIKAIKKSVLDAAATKAINDFTVRFNTAMTGGNFDWLTKYADFLDFEHVAEYTAFDLADTNAVADLKTKIDELTKNLISTISFTDFNKLGAEITLDDVLVKSTATTTALDALCGTGKIFADKDALSKFLKPGISVVASNYDHAYITYGVDRKVVAVNAGNASAVPNSKEIPISFSIDDYKNAINNGDWSAETIQDQNNKALNYKQLQTLSASWTNPSTGFDAFKSIFATSSNVKTLSGLNTFAKTKLSGLSITNVNIAQTGTGTATDTKTDVNVALTVKDQTNATAQVKFILKDILFTNPAITKALATAAKDALTDQNVFVNGGALQKQLNSTTLPLHASYILGASTPNLATIINNANEVFLTNTKSSGGPISFFNNFNTMKKNQDDVLTITVEIPGGGTAHPDNANVTVNADNTSEPLLPTPTPYSFQVPILWLDKEQATATTDINNASSDFKDAIDKVKDNGYLSQDSIDALNKTVDNMETIAKTQVQTATDPTVPSTVATGYKNELDKKKPMLDFLDSKMGDEIVQEIKNPDGSIDLNNAELIKYKNLYDQIKNNPEYKDLWDQLKTMDLKDFKSLNLKNMNKLEGVNDIVMKVMTGLGALMGLTGIGLGSSVIATATANRRLKNRKDNTIRFQGIKKLFSFQTIISIASIGASVGLLVYVFVVRGGF